MPFIFTAVNKEEVLARLRARAQSVGGVLVSEMRNQMQISADYSRANKLSGDPLKHRTGTLSRSVTGSATLDGSVVIGKLGSDVRYAHVHELGGTFQIPEHFRRTGYGSKQQRITMLTKSGSVRAAVKSMTRGTVKAHSATYPQRPFLRPAIDDRRDEILSALRARLIEELKSAT